MTNYLPGQCTYNLCEYPSRERWTPGEQDERILDRLKEQGIQLIQVMDDWNDQMGLFSGHKLDALNPQGFRRFVAMVHQRGMKILAYISSGYFTRTDPHFRNRETYLVLANYGATAAEIATANAFATVGETSGGPTKQWSVAPGTLQIVRRVLPA